MAHYPRTPRTRTPMLAPQPAPVLYASVGTAPYQSPGSHYPGPQLYHVAASEPYSRGRHRSSSRSRNHRRSNSSGGGRHHRHRHRSSTPSRSMPSHYSPGAQYAAIPSTRHRRRSTSVANHNYRSSSRGPHRPVHYNPHGHHRISHRGESIGERIKRFFGIGAHKVRFVNQSGQEVDHLGRPVYPY